MVVDEIFLLIKTKLDKASQAEANAEIDKTAKKTATVGKKSKVVATDFQKAFKSVASSASRSVPLIGGLIDALGMKSMKVIGIIASIAVALKGLSVATKVYLEFESGMKRVQAVMLASDADMRKLEKSALAEAKGSIFNPKEATEAQKYLSQAGLNVNEVIGALPKTLQLASAANMDLGRASDISTDIMSAQGLAVQDLGMINDSLVKGANLATISVENLGLSMGKVSNEAQHAGINVQLMSASLGVVANAGMKVEGGTYFRNMLMELRSSRVKNAMKKVGVDVSKYINMGTGEFTDMIGLMKEAKSLSKEKSFQLLQEGFGKSSRGKRAFLALIDGADKLEKNYKEILNATGVAEKASRVAFKGLSGEWKQSKSILEVTAVQFMKKTGLIDIFTDVVDIGATIMQGLLEFTAPLMGFLTTGARLVAKLIKIVVNVGRIVTRFLGDIISFFLRFLMPTITLFTNIFERIASGLEVISDNAVWLKNGDESVSQLEEAFQNMIDNAMEFWNPLLELIDLFINYKFFDNKEAKVAFDAYKIIFEEKAKEAFKSVMGFVWDIMKEEGAKWIKLFVEVLKITLQDMFDNLIAYIWQKIKDNTISGVTSQLAGGLADVITGENGENEFLSFLKNKFNINSPEGALATPSVSNNNKSNNINMSGATFYMQGDINSPTSDSLGLELGLQLSSLLQQEGF